MTMYCQATVYVAKVLRGAKPADPSPDRAQVCRLLEQPARPIDATQALNLSAEVSNCQGLTWPFVELTRYLVQMRLPRLCGSQK